MLLSGKVALVAGVGRGLGAETALALAQFGADVVLMARSPKTVEEVRTRIGEMGRRAEISYGDVSNEADCSEAVALAHRLYGRLDILVVNAFSQGERSTILDAQPDDWRSVFDVNLIGPVLLAKAAVPVMASLGGGSIVLVNSDQAWRVVPGFAAYSASKSALISLMRHMAREFGPIRIRVNSVHPGMIMGDALEGFFVHLASLEGASPDAIQARFASNAALGYIPDAREMAGAIVFFASHLSRAISGQSLCVDGGGHFH